MKMLTHLKTDSITKLVRINTLTIISRHMVVCRAAQEAGA